MVVELNDTNFQAEVLQSTKPVLVDFWASWCGPCKMIGPIVHEIAEEYKDKIKVAKLNVDDAQAIASQFNIMSIPTLMVFKNGEVVETMVGAMPKSKLVAALKAYLA